jgi:galactose mutarotase-like enzyme
MSGMDTIAFYADYRGQRASVLENDMLKAVILPERGGKTASIVYKPRNFELLAQPKGEYPPLAPGMNFSLGDASGFDDAFPSIDPETVNVGGKQVAYSDHGEIWTMSMQADLLDGGVMLTGESKLLPYSYQKEIRLDGDKIIYRYMITHVGGEPFPCMWACHCLMRYETDMRLSYPKGAKYAENVLQSNELGVCGACHALAGGVYDFTSVPPPESLTMVKYYLQGCCGEGWCGCRYPSQSVVCDMEFDAQALPYLGFWLTAGGYRGEYNCAFEPATGYYDSISRAQATKTVYVLEHGKTLSFSLTLHLRTL